VTTEALIRVGPDEFAQQRDAIVALDARVREAEGHEALGDAVWRDLAHPGSDSAGFLLDDRGYAHVARGDRGDDESWTAALAVPPPADAGTTPLLLDAAVAHAAAQGARRLTSWVFGADADDTCGFEACMALIDRAVFHVLEPLLESDAGRCGYGVLSLFDPPHIHAHRARAGDRDSELRGAARHMRCVGTRHHGLGGGAAGVDAGAAEELAFHDGDLHSGGGEALGQRGPGLSRADDDGVKWCHVSGDLLTPAAVSGSSSRRRRVDGDCYSFFSL